MHALTRSTPNILPEPSSTNKRVRRCTEGGPLPAAPCSVLEGGKLRSAIYRNFSQFFSGFLTGHSVCKPLKNFLTYDLPHPAPPPKP